MPEDIGNKSYYEKDGQKFVRVTHILKVLAKPGLDRWRGFKGNQEADAISREGSRIGSEFHKIAAGIARGEHEGRFWFVPDEYRYMAEAYIDWFHRHVEEVVKVETTYYSDETDEEPDELAHAGTPDLVAVLRGDTVPSLIDLKTSNSYSDDWPLQLSAYRRLMRRSGLPTFRRQVIRIPKVGIVTPEIYDFSREPGADEADEAAWLRTMGLWRWFQRGRARKKAALVA